MIYQYLKENEEVILRAGKKERWGKFLYPYEKKEKQRLADLKKWKSKIKKFSTGCLLTLIDNNNNIRV